MPLLELIDDPVLPDGTRLLDVRIPDQAAHPFAPPLATNAMTDPTNVPPMRLARRDRGIDVPELRRTLVRAREAPAGRGGSRGKEPP